MHLYCRKRNDVETPTPWRNVTWHSASLHTFPMARIPVLSVVPQNLQVPTAPLPTLPAVSEEEK